MCGSARWRTARPAAATPDDPGARWQVVECSGCRLWRTEPSPSDAELEAAYSGDYGPHREAVPPPDPGSRHLADRVRWAALARRFGYTHLRVRVAAPWNLLAWLFVRPPFRLPRWRGRGRALEVGCGSGGLLPRLSAAGWRVCGIEPSPAAARRARATGLEVHAGTIDCFDAAGRSFDLIVLHHVLEHVRDPVALLARCGELLAPDGAILLRVPNAGGLGCRLFGRRWRPLDLPRHLFHFTPPTLRAAAERAGLAVVRWRCASSPRTLQQSLAAALPALASLVRRRLARRLLRLPASLLDLLHRGDEIEAELVPDRQSAGGSTGGAPSP